MTTLIECVFVTPDGTPLADAEVRIQATRAGYVQDLDGIVVPRELTTVCDAQGRCTIGLWPSPEKYSIVASDPASDAELFYLFLVPEVPQGTVLRLQDLLLDGIDPSSSLKIGPTSERPVGASVGDHYFDMTLLKTIRWNGQVWKDTALNTV